ncbi:MAG: transposase family protein, partial [Mycobacterium sp.]|nr:transposase family protein [Mycobacterium sp.]
ATTTRRRDEVIWCWNTAEDYPSKWAAIGAVSKRLAMHAETLRNWICQQMVEDAA